jgi:hypothetical protein
MCIIGQCDVGVFFFGPIEECLRLNPTDAEFYESILNYAFFAVIQTKIYGSIPNI